MKPTIVSPASHCLACSAFQATITSASSSMALTPMRCIRHLNMRLNNWHIVKYIFDKKEKVRIGCVRLLETFSPTPKHGFESVTVPSLTTQTASRAVSWNDIDSDKTIPVRPSGWTSCATPVHRRSGVWFSYALTRSKVPAAPLEYASGPVLLRETISCWITWYCHLGFEYCYRLCTSSKNLNPR